MISEKSGEYLVELAKKTVVYYLETGKKLEVPDNHPIELDEKLGVFVTLNKNNVDRIIKDFNSNHSYYE